MKWSLTLARVSGIDVRVHITFLLILALGAFQWGPGFGLSGAAFGVLLMLALFAFVTLHELGHSLVAQRFGIPVREIVLFPLGGIAFLGRNATKPLHELLIAAAGPAVNVVAAVLILVGGSALGLLQLGGLRLGLVAGEPSLSTALTWLLGANVALFVFNLIPAFPLDGGRILRALLWMGLGVRRADQIASYLGQTIAIGLGFFGLMSGNLSLLLIAGFVFLGANQHGAEGQARSVLDGVRVGEAYNRHALTLAPADRVEQVVGYLLTSYQTDFAVVHGDRLLGVVTRDAALRALSRHEQDGFVSSIMERDVLRVEASRTLGEVRELMGERGVQIAAVYAGEAYLGLVSQRDIAEAYAVLQLASQGTPPREREIAA